MRSVFGKGCLALALILQGCGSAPGEEEETESTSSSSPTTTGSTSVYEWTDAISSGAPEVSRILFSSVWTGTYMAIFGGIQGGFDAGIQSTGYYFTPTENSWGQMPTAGSPQARYGHCAVMMDNNKMIVWGGLGSSSLLNDGGILDIDAYSWSAMSTTGAPSARLFPGCVSNGSKMVVFGGINTDGTAFFKDGAVYDLASDSWTAIAEQPERYFVGGWFGHAALNDTSAVFFNAATGNVGVYDITSGTWDWRGAPEGYLRRVHQAAALQGGSLFVFGGLDLNGTAGIHDGWRLDLSTGVWRHTSLVDQPERRWGGSMVAVDGRLRLWGGWQPATNTAVSAGGIYDPETDEWSVLESTNAPTPRAFHQAVSTGSSMVVWGGTNFFPLKDAADSAFTWATNASAESLTTARAQIDAAVASGESAVSTIKDQINASIASASLTTTALTGLPCGLLYSSENIVDVLFRMPSYGGGAIYARSAGTGTASEPVVSISVTMDPPVVTPVAEEKEEKSVDCWNPF